MKTIQLIRQHDSMECGISCLKMIFKYYGKDASRKEIILDGTNF